MTDALAIPAAFAERRLFEPIAPWLARFNAPGVPSRAALDVLLAETAPAAHSGGGARIRFAAPGEDEAGYEARIFTTGEVPTREADWHDFFNALAWCAWPRTKACCNRLHLDELRARAAAGLAGRGPRRDALTQFDECGIVVVSADPELPALLAAHEWEEVFWRRREALQRSTRFLVFGHGSWDQLRTPFPACAPRPSTAWSIPPGSRCPQRRRSPRPTPGSPPTSPPRSATSARAASHPCRCSASPA